VTGWRAALACRTGVLAGVLLVISACGSKNVRPHLDEPFPTRLSAWHLFTGKLSALQPNSGVIPYDINTPLFSDYAAKYRFVWMPAGTSATYSDTDAFNFPPGAIFAKTFVYPGAGPGRQRRIIETRLLVRAKSGWIGLPYVWNRRKPPST
jgi:hypothetical protein